MSSLSLSPIYESKVWTLDFLLEARRSLGLRSIDSRPLMRINKFSDNLILGIYFVDFKDSYYDR